MRKLQVEICNERLLPRFGVDRLLLLLAERLLAHGHDVRLTCLRYDESLLKPALAESITAFNLPPGLDMQGTEAAVTERLLGKWQDEGAPDVMIIGGWPFFEAAARARGGVGSIFIDAGAVAQDGMPEALLPVQLELRRIRQITLPAIGRLLPISDFIRRSQSEPDRGSAEGVRTVLLGGDHLAAVEGGGELPIAGRELLAELDARLGRGEQLLLSLGRFEANTYKNSTLAYEMLRRLKVEIPTARLLLLDAGQDCGIPPELSDAVISLGAPDDAALVEVMRRCAAGVSTSFWEGFNLPIAEMQWLGRPALAFPCGAHPEVIAEPWLLCETIEEMARKTARLLRGDVPLELEAKFAAWRRRLTWDATLSAGEDEIATVAAKPSDQARRRVERNTFVTTRNPSG